MLPGSFFSAARPFARSCSSVMAFSASPVSKIQCNPVSGRARPHRQHDERLHALGIFHEDGFGMAGSHVFHLIGKRIRGVERRRNGAIRENAKIGEIEFGAGLRMQRHRIALSDAQLPQAAGNFLGCALILQPSIGLIIAFAGGLMQSRSVAKSPGGFFEDRIHGARTHSPIVDVLRCGLC